MTNLQDDPCTVTYELREKDGGTEFDLIIENTIVGSKLQKEMLGARGFISSNLKAMAETGKPAFTGKLVGLMSPVMALIAKAEQKVELSRAK